MKNKKHLFNSQRSNNLKKLNSFAEVVFYFSEYTPQSDFIRILADVSEFIDEIETSDPETFKLAFKFRALVSNSLECSYKYQFENLNKLKILCSEIEKMANSTK